MKLGIVGSRGFDCLDFFLEKVNAAVDAYGITHIVSGGAIGADTLARNYAHINGISLIEHHAQWNKFGKSAGYKRNKLIWEDSDVILVFWDGESKGTKHTIDNYKGKMFVFLFNKETYPEHFI